MVNSVGSRGDSYDNAMAESVNGLYKTELVRKRGPGRGLEGSSSWPRWSGSTGTTTVASSSHRLRPARRVRSQPLP